MGPFTYELVDLGYVSSQMGEISEIKKLAIKERGKMGKMGQKSPKCKCKE